jgi:predicted RNA binding protein YcfA (HicA-like mRNA interferase family)
MGKRGTPPLEPSEVIAILKALDFRYARTAGSHAHYIRLAEGKRLAALVSVDTHYKQFDDDLIKNMIRQSTFTKDQFYGATRVMHAIDQGLTHVHATSSVPKTLFLRCYAFKDQGQFAAECIDLDILVKAKTLEIAKRKLKQAIVGYLGAAIESGNEAVLIPRKSPLYNRMRYHAFCALYMIHQTSHLMFFKFQPDRDFQHCSA